MSAGVLAGLVKKCRDQQKTAKQTQALLEFVHPILMENVRVTEAGILALRSVKHIWIRRGRWQAGFISDPRYTN
jgi:hypothetical protein